MKTNKRILIVDDNAEFCENIKDVLELKGYEAVGVHDGFKALEAVRRDGYDIVLMDIKMPMMDGVETFRKLKEISPKIPVIMITAHAVEDCIREALRKGACGIFEKPIDFKRLICGIENALPDGQVIMVVDDNQELSANLLDVLAEKGYRGVIANDGKTAIQMARENKFDSILLDIKLPDMSGLEAYQAIRDVRPGVIVIIITAYMEEMGATIERSLQSDVYSCLEKPLDMDRLFEVIQTALESDTGN